MRTLLKIPVTHSTVYAQYYDIYLRCSSANCSRVRFCGYTDYRGERGDSIKGVALKCLRENPDGMLTLPFSGFLRFEIPESGRIQENAGICLVLDWEGNHTVDVQIQDVFLNNTFNKPQFLSINGGNGFYDTFPVEHVSVVPTRIAEQSGKVSFDVPGKGAHDYILLYKDLGDGEIFDETECRLFVPKTNYCLDEPITFTYKNVYLKYDVDIYMVDILLYLEGDKPGVHQSRDYVTVMYQERSRGLDGALSMPVDGARGYLNRISGHYTLRLMQKYEDLCPFQAFTISTKHKNDELKAPPAGTLFYIKASSLPDSVEIQTKNPEQLSVIHFTCDSPIADMLEQGLYYMRDVAHGMGLLRRFAQTPDRLLHSVVSQVLHTAYSVHMQEVEESSGQRVAHSISDRIAAFINHNLSNNISMQMLVDEFHISESHLSHSFKRHKGISVSKYIYNAKVNRAKQWLAENELTVTEIAKLLNYSDIHAFSHSFKLLVGMSPLEYRKMNRKK